MAQSSQAQSHESEEKEVLHNVDAKRKLSFNSSSSESSASSSEEEEEVSSQESQGSSQSSPAQQTQVLKPEENIIPLKESTTPSAPKPASSASSEEDEEESSEEKELRGADEKILPKENTIALKSPSLSEEEESETDSENQGNAGEKPLSKKLKSLSEDSEADSEEEDKGANTAELTLPEKSATAPEPSLPPKPQSSSSGSEDHSGSTEIGATKKRALDRETYSNGAPKKRARIRNGGVSRKRFFQRVFTEEDELIILQTLNDHFKSEVPLDINVLHNMIKESLHVAVTKSQLSDKVRKMKQKFKNKMLLVSNTTDKAFELSKKLWGKVETNSVEGKFGNSNIDAKMESGNNSQLDVASVFDCQSKKMEEVFLNQVLKIAPEPNKTAMQDEWNKIKKEEFELSVKKMGLIYKSAKLVLQAMN